MNNRNVKFWSRVLMVVALITASSCILPPAESSDLFRNETYGFSMRFPEGWVVQEGTEPDVILKASDERGSSVIIGIRKVPPGFTPDKLSSKTISDFMDEIREKFPDAALLESGIRAIDDRKAIYFKSRITYTAGDSTGQGINTIFVTVQDGKLFWIGCWAPSDVYSETEPVFTDIVSTFSFDKAAPAGGPDDSRLRPPATAYLLMYLFIVMTGLIVPVLLRIGIFRKPLGTKSAAIVCASLEAAYIVISIATGSAWILLALTGTTIAGYFILRSTYGTRSGEPSQKPSHPAGEQATTGSSMNKAASSDAALSPGGAGSAEVRAAQEIVDRPQDIEWYFLRGLEDSSLSQQAIRDLLRRGKIAAEGPFSEEGLMNAYREKRVAETTLVWTEEMKEWKTMRECPPFSDIIKEAEYAETKGEPSTMMLKVKIEKLRELRDEGIITSEEYEKRHRSLLEEYLK